VIFNNADLSSRTMALGSIQPLREMSNKGLPVDSGLLAHKADNITTICELTV
jgi:hypothetical protein